MQDASSKQQTKQKYKPNHQQTGLPPHSVLPIRGKTNKQTKNSAQISPYDKPTQTTGPNLGEQKPKERKNSTLKPGKRNYTLCNLSQFTLLRLVWYSLYQRMEPFCSMHLGLKCQLGGLWAQPPCKPGNLRLLHKVKAWGSFYITNLKHSKFIYIYI